jgi:hypothetical protein
VTEAVGRAAWIHLYTPTDMEQFFVEVPAKDMHGVERGVREILILQIEQCMLDYVLVQRGGRRTRRTFVGTYQIEWREDEDGSAQAEP